LQRGKGASVNQWFVLEATIRSYKHLYMTQAKSQAWAQSACHKLSSISLGTDENAKFGRSTICFQRLSEYSPSARQPSLSTWLSTIFQSKPQSHKACSSSSTTHCLDTGASNALAIPWRRRTLMQNVVDFELLCGDCCCDKRAR